MPILTSDGKQVEKRYTADGKNVRTVYNSNGDVVFEEIDTAEGALPQTFKSKGKPLVNYRIYGNTVQNGTPTPDNPVEVQGCGVETENGYKLDIILTNALENTSVTTPVYIGQSPLYKIGDYADYVDYKRGGVMRRIKEFIFTGNEAAPSITNSTTEEGTNAFAFRFSDIGMTDILNYDKEMKTIPYPVFYSSHFKQKIKTVNYYEIKNGEIGANSVGLSITYNRYVIFGSTHTTIGAFKNYLAAQYAAGTPVKVYYVLATPKFEPIADLAKIPTFTPQTVIDADMTVKPSKIWYKYKP